MRDKLRSVIRILAVLAILLCVFYLVREELDNRANRSLYEQMKQTEGTEAETEEGHRTSYDLELLKERNPDCVGIIEVPGTGIDYPVVLSDREDGLYYLYHSFDQEREARGSIFMDYRCDPDKPSANLMIYGHRMRNGQMFGSLKEYRSKEFWQEHQIVYYTDSAGTRTYRIFAVCLSKDPSAMSEKQVKYQMQFTDPSKPEELEEFVAGMKEWSLYQTGVETEGSREFITLRTCDYAVRNGRISVIAVREDNQQTQPDSDEKE